MDRQILPDGKSRRFFHYMICFISAAFLCLFVYMSLRGMINGGFVKALFCERAVTYIALTYLVIFAGVTVMYVLWKRSGGQLKIKTWFLILFIFVAALIPRLLIASRGEYIPTNDFHNYYNMMRLFDGEEGYAAAKEAMGIYCYYTYYMLGIIYGLIGLLFGASYAGVQLAMCVMTSLCAVLIFLIVARFNKKCAFFAGLLFAIYPSNLFMGNFTNNQNGGVLFALLAIYILLVATDKKRGVGMSILLGSLSGLSLLLSHYCHPSSTTTRIAAGIYLVVLVVTFLRDKKRLISTLCILLSFFTVLVGCDRLCNYILKDSGFIEEEKQDDTDVLMYMSKIAVGLNPENHGQFHPYLYSIAVNYDHETANEMYTDYVKEFVSDPEQLWNTLMEKARVMWGGSDTPFTWYINDIYNRMNQERADKTVTAAAEQQYDELTKFIRGMYITDVMFTFSVYLMAIVGIFYLRKRSYMFDLPLWALLGWIGVHVLIEVQPRYRYFGMTIIIMLAGIGASFLLDKLSARLNKPKVTENEAKTENTEKSEEKEYAF